MVIGDGGVGKLFFLICVIISYFLSDYVFIVFDNYSVDFVVNSFFYLIFFWDIVG